ncbi:epoxide hydrolase [Hahella sp. CCB-MM4]|nr:epoxide hydrolase [Hahella sp. CCB-MM4]
MRHLRVDANGTSFHVAVASPSQSSHDGDVPEIFCLHGFPEGWQSWRQLMDYLPEARIYAPDLRGYPTSEYPRDGYDVFTLTDDVRELMARLNVKKPILLTHDWGGALGWIFAHRFSDLISRLVVVNCTHPKTLVRAVFQLDDWQTFRIPWVLPFQPPVIPELLLTTAIGRRLLELSFTLREGPDGNMNRQLVKEMVNRYQHRKDLRGAIEYYRAVVKTLVIPKLRKELEEVYQQPIQVPTTLVWGMTDEALSSKVAQKSEGDAGCPVEWRPLHGIGHFVDLEAPQLLAEEVRRLF